MSDDTYQVVHYADAPTVAPTVAPISTTSFNPLYRASGALAGLMLLDSPSQQVLFYPDATFTNSKALASGATSMQLLYDRSGSSSALVDGLMFFSVTQNSFDAIYRLDVNGNAISVAAGLISVDGSAVADDSSLFFVATLSSTTPTPKMFQLDLGGSGGPLLLYTATAGSATTYRLIGSNGSVLVFYSTTGGTSTSSTIMSVPKGTQTPTANTLAAIDGSMVAFMFAPSFDDPPNDKIFVDVTKTSTVGSSSTVVRTSEVLSPSGAVLEAPLANSLYLYRTSALADSVWQFKGITDTDGNYGGSSLYSVKISDFTASVFNTTAGTPFVVPTSQVLGLAAIASTGGEGQVVQSASVPSTGAAFDTSKLLIVPISIANTDISFE
ncbi:MAG TPA: hypothetical protein VNR70_02170 [Steroidobacteraceae bacterium]|nr:hypothetical protein [Steroidobacteraceae bacterium]